MTISYSNSMISIHALREEGDVQCERPSKAGKKFLSTPSARRATRGGAGLERSAHYFYPRPPRGGRPSKAMSILISWAISIHALREEGDGLAGWVRALLLISIHALREEGD